MAAAPIAHRLVPLLILIFLSGCSFGPQLLQEGYLDYNERVRATVDEELLLNIIRLHYLDTVEFLAINSISSQADLDSFETVH